MPFPVVAVTLPEDTPPAYVAGLLSACTQAYAQGTCKRDSDLSQEPQRPDGSAASSEPASTASVSPNALTPSTDSPEDSEASSEAPILATVSWSSPTTVSLLLGLPHWRNNRWLERAITFQEPDQPLERYRAIGFTIGSLAGTVSEVARLEQEAREAGATPAAEQGSSESPEAPRLERPVATETRSPSETRPRPSLAEPDPASHWFVRVFLAAELGEGFDALRRGGSLGVGVYTTGWGTHLSGYYTDGSGSGIDATFAGAEWTLDFRLRVRALEAQLSVGGGYGVVRAQVNKEQTEGFPSGVVALQIMPAEWTFAPYLGLGARIFRGIATDVPGLDHLGPITPFVHLGVAVGSTARAPAPSR